MIAKERLKELIEQESTIYYISSKKVREIKLKKRYYIYKQTLNWYIEHIMETNIYPDFRYNNLKDLYETKEEAEFTLKYYTKKIIKFEPPTFESVSKELETKEDKMFIIIRIRTYRLMITCFCNTNLLSIQNLDLPIGSMYTLGEFTRENYYKALDIMNEKFLEYNGVWYGCR